MQYKHLGYSCSSCHFSEYKFVINKILKLLMAGVTHLTNWLCNFSGKNGFFPFDYSSADKIFSHVFSITQCAYIWRLVSEAANVYEHSPRLVWNCRYWRGDCTLHSSTEVWASNACVECDRASLHFWLRSASYFHIMVLSFIDVQNAQCLKLILGHLVLPQRRYIITHLGRLGKKHS